MCIKTNNFHTAKVLTQGEGDHGLVGMGFDLEGFDDVADGVEGLLGEGGGGDGPASATRHCADVK